GNFSQGLIPTDADEIAGISFSLAFGRDPAHGKQNPLGRVNTIKVLGDLGAKEPSGHGMPGITLDARGAAVFHRNQNSARVWTIVRAGSVNHLLGHDKHYRVFCLRISGRICRGYNCISPLVKRYGEPTSGISGSSACRVLRPRSSL